MKERVVVSWSGGKDSSLALYHLLKDDRYTVDSLLTTVTEGYKRISVHDVRESLLDDQAKSLGIPLRKMYIPQESSHSIYKERMDEQLKQIKEDGINTVMFGDIFLEDVRSYREELIHKQKLKAIFPLWGRPTSELIQEFLSLGFKTVTTCIDTEVLTDEFLGRHVDDSFLKELPEDVDKCGENGEFHTFTYAGPLFTKPVHHNIGGKVNKGRFHFSELV
ncbi:diphthine--ammonia ligase [Virgibacillus sp. DJP39]|uniref:Dph6-related ATP pyrophosphatase n=1 Tax=Virgibacillus sp. DJP39 TaxID=3409790 RepID=UPI003BB5442B